MNIKEVMEQNPEGFSINLLSMSLDQTPTEGFIVAISNIKTELEDAETTFKRLLIASTVVNAKDKHLFIGGWKDSRGFFLDLSVWVETSFEAQVLGSIFRQREIWDCSEKRSYTTPLLI